MNPLDVLVGEWTMTAVFDGQEMTGGRCVFEWMEGGELLVQRTEVPGPAPSSLAVIAPDGDGYLQHYFDTRGVVRLYKMTLRDGVWSLVRDQADFSPLEFKQRFMGHVMGDAIRGAWEKTEGETWVKDFDLAYTRVSGR
jgi:hypothetical protein